MKYRAFRLIFVFVTLFMPLVGKDISIEQNIAGLYIAYFDRAPDKNGLEYWKDKGEKAQSGGKNISEVLKELSSGFALHPVFMSTYSGLDNKAFVEAIYRNVLGKDGDSEGVNYWTNYIDSGKSRSDMVSDFVQASLSSDLTKENFPNLSDDELRVAQIRQDLITNKVEVALAFVQILGDKTNVLDSKNPENAPSYIASKNILIGITEDKAIVDDTIKFLDSIKNDSNPISIINNKFSTQKIIITGYVIDDPIQNATIELQDINGTLIQIFEGITKTDGSYTIKVDKEYKDKDFILKAYNGIVSNKSFDGDLYGYHISGDELNINLTPLNTMLIILSSQFNDIDFSARLAKAKDLLSATYGISEGEFSSIKDSSFSSFDVVKFRELVNSIGFNNLIQSLVADSIDGYADENNSKLLFPSAKQRVLRDAEATFQIVDTNLSNGNEEISNLRIEGTSEDENGNKGTFDNVTDVVAIKEVIIEDIDGNKKEEEQIFYRSFNIGKWSDKLNEETTLLARVFIDPILMNLSVKEQEKIANQLVENDEFKNALKTQKMYLQAPKLFEYIYNDSLSILTKEALSYISSKTQEKATKRYLKKIGVLNKTDTDIDNIGGSLRLKYDKSTNTFTFRNYHNIFLGLRAYEENKDYEFSTTLQDNIINPVSGGAIGTGISMIQEWLNLDIIGTPADTYMYGKAFDSELFETETKAKPNQEQLYEIYKYQGVTDITTLLNTLRITEVILGGFGNYITKFKELKEKFKNFNSKVADAFELSLAISECSIIINEYMNLFNSNEIINKNESYSWENNIDNGRELINKFIDTYRVFFENEGRYNELLENGEFNFNKSILFAIFGKALYPENTTLKNAIESIQDKKLKTKIYISAFFIKQFYNVYLKPKKMIDYNYYSIDEMHYIVPIWMYMSRDKAKKILKKYKYGIGAKIGTKGIPSYLELIFSDGSFKKFVSNFIEQGINNSFRELEDLTKFVDFIKNTSRSIANVDIFSIGSLKVIFKFLKDSGIISINADVIATKIATRVTPGLGQAKVILGFNEGLSWAIGTYIIPNKSYFKVKTDSEGNIKLEYPPFSILGLLSDDIEEKKNWIGSKIYRKDGSDNFLVITDSYYQPIFNIYYNSKDKYSIVNAEYDNNILANLKYNIRKSLTDSKYNFDDDLGNVNNTNNEEAISPSSVKSLLKSGDYGYYFDLYQAWMEEQGTNYYIKNKTRGVYKEWLEATFNYPINYTSQKIPTQSNVRYIYKVSTGDDIAKNLILKKSKDTLYITNNNNFPICMEVYYEKDKDGSIIDNGYYEGDYCLNGKSSDYLDMFKYKDNGEYNDMKFIFFDKIAEDYFKEEKYNAPQYFNWFKESKGLKDLTYEIDLDDIGTGELFKLINTNIKSYYSFRPDDKIILEFDDELKIDDEQPEIGISSKNIIDNIFFKNKSTQEIKRLYNWDFELTNCQEETTSSTNTNGHLDFDEELRDERSRCDINYKVLEIDVSPIIDDGEYELVIGKSLQSKSGKSLSKSFKYDINTYHPNSFEIEEKNIETDDNQLKINYRVFIPYNSTRLNYLITISDKNVTGIFNFKGGPGHIEISPCSLNIYLETKNRIYKENIINYTNLIVTIINTKDTSINDKINIKVCDDYNNCEEMTKNINLSASMGEKCNSDME